MHKRWRLWLGILIVALLFIVPPIAYDLYDPNPIRYDKYEQIRDEMTDDDIIALLGCKPGDYTTGVVDYEIGEDAEHTPLDDEMVWRGNRGDIIIYRDAEGRMTGKRRIIGQREPLLKTGVHWLWDLMRGR